jgi:hypothetical protein
MRGRMVKSLRYDQANSPDHFRPVVIDCMQCAGHTDPHTNFYGYAAPNRNTTPYSHADARVDLSAAESRGNVGAARPI